MTGMRGLRGADGVDSVKWRGCGFGGVNANVVHDVLVQVWAEAWVLSSRASTALPQ